VDKKWTSLVEKLIELGWEPYGVAMTVADYELAFAETNADTPDELKELRKNADNLYVFAKTL
jgi:hypothetical protein